MTDIETAAKAEVSAIKADIAKANSLATSKIKTDVDGAWHWASSRLWVVALLIAGAVFLFRHDAAALIGLIKPIAAIVAVFLLGQSAVEIATVLKKS